MQTLKVSVSLPDATHPDIELRLSANDSDCDVVIALPLAQRSKPVVVAETSFNDAASAADDEYVLGGYAGI
ncbi:hypothetical protein B0E47_07555 [Rhodanobacter sp. B05]|uniref:hypothetical protein n=1 Tax=Rhodanobacter sp. B05 TaxID=1945859 RepID=UPI000987071D|nr:hypothetical protein [Rhodanobacter sp. B05]OOG55727.1 hypothetical protein B0E47_07555 [Rhodanobacter sp. B05]